VLVDNAAIACGMAQEPTRADPAFVQAVVQAKVIGVTSTMMPALVMQGTG
jgi:hypothetical protein